MPCTIEVDGKLLQVSIPAGSSVQQVLDNSSITTYYLDRIDPPPYTLITTSIHIAVTRIEEKFDTDEILIPFSQQTVRNESIPPGQTILAQVGLTGVQQITYRRIIENGIERSRTEVKRVTIQEPRPEIIMVGIQTSLLPVPITNRLVFLTAGNAWMMEENTGKRKPLILTGDLDGRIFSLSPDGNWLLFSRKTDKPLYEQLNSLWIINTEEENAIPVDLRIFNVVHFAEWAPIDEYSVYYSTVEPRITAPGWQANNDLYLLSISPHGELGKREEFIGTNSGGVYGWWGTGYYWTAGGDVLAYSRPDSIGIVNLKQKISHELFPVLPYQTRSSWAWSPFISISPNGRILYTVDHIIKSGLASDEASPIFNIIAFDLSTGLRLSLTSVSGMFAYPVPSPTQSERFILAYLRAENSEQSETSRYRLMIMDQDGSNQRTLFPDDAPSGLDPQQPVWSPQPKPKDPLTIAIVYQGNIWFIYPDNNLSRQITGDGLISRIDWK